MKLSNVNRIHDTFIEDIDNKISDYTNLLNRTLQEKAHLLLLVGEIQDILSSNGLYVNNELSSLKDDNCNTFQSSAFSKEYIDNIKLINEDRISTSVLKLHLHTLILKCAKIYNIREQIKVLNVYLNTPYALYKDIIEEYNFSNSKELLKGHEVTLGFRIGTLLIRNKPRVFSTYEEREFKGTIEWNESYTILKSIAKKQEEQGVHTLYSQHINKELKKPDFFIAMKPYVYNKDTNPNGDKYIMFRTDDRQCMVDWCNNRLAGDSVFSFTPNNYINTESRSQYDFQANAKDENEIIESTKLGLRDKLNILIRFNPNYISNFTSI